MIDDLRQLAAAFSAGRSGASHGAQRSRMRLRAALGDDAEKPRYIETLPRFRGWIMTRFELHRDLRVGGSQRDCQAAAKRRRPSRAWTLLRSSFRTSPYS